MEKEENMRMVNQNLRENIQKDPEMEKEKNMIILVDQNLKVNIWVVKEMEKEKNIIRMVL